MGKSYKKKSSSSSHRNSLHSSSISIQNRNSNSIHDVNKSISPTSISGPLPYYTSSINHLTKAMPTNSHGNGTGFKSGATATSSGVRKIQQQKHTIKKQLMKRKASRPIKAFPKGTQDTSPGIVFTLPMLLDNPANYRGKFVRIIQRNGAKDQISSSSQDADTAASILVSSSSSTSLSDLPDENINDDNDNISFITSTTFGSGSLNYIHKQNQRFFSIYNHPKQSNNINSSNNMTTTSLRTSSRRQASSRYSSSSSPTQI